jgi:hypothetical protein
VQGDVPHEVAQAGFLRRGGRQGQDVPGVVKTGFPPVVVKVANLLPAANTTVPTATPFKASVRVVEAAAAAVALTFDPLKSVLPFWFAPI